MSSFPRPEINNVNTPYWRALDSGELIFQRCICGNAWLPPRERCPACLRSKIAWERSQGQGHIVSWVVFHHTYHPAFAECVPYNVAVVQLEEGPRLITNIVDPSPLEVAMPVKLVVKQRGDTSLAMFTSARS